MIEGWKDTFDFGVEMALVTFVYEGIGSKFCLRLSVRTKNTRIFFQSLSKVWYTLIIGFV